MPNQFCRYLSNGYSFALTTNSESVVVRPCCLYKGSVNLDSQLLQNRRLKFESITDWTSACAKCNRLEAIGQPSLRQAGPDWIDEFEDSQDPVSIDIRLDLACNAACVTCSAGSSTLWQKEDLKLHNKVITLDNVDHLVDQAINNIVNSVSLEKLKYVKFFGGEPLFTDTHLKFIKHIPHPEMVTLHYTTNGSIYPNDEVLAEWKKFKLVIFAASLDGIEAQFDYVRWPLPWHKVSQNLIRLRENKDIWNLMFRVEFTANFLNTYYYDRLENWVNTNLSSNLSGDATDICIHPCHATWAIERMPASIRLAIMEKYPSNHIIHKLVADLPEQQSLVPWQEFVNIWDSRRKNSWQQAFPDLVELLDNKNNK